MLHSKLLLRPSGSSTETERQDVHDIGRHKHPIIPQRAHPNPADLVIPSLVRWSRVLWRLPFTQGAGTPAEQSNIDANISDTGGAQSTICDHRSKHPVPTGRLRNQDSKATCEENVGAEKARGGGDVEKITGQPRKFDYYE